MKKTRRALIAIIIALPCLAIVCNALVHQSARGHVYTDVRRIPKARVALVLGCGVRPNGRLSPNLAARVDRAIELYRAGKVEKLLMSGDNRFKHYNEPEKMQQYAVRKGVPPEDIAMDYAGRRTYDSVYRAKHIFGLSEVIIVTQRWHMDRALFLCRSLGVKANGLADPMPNPRATKREVPATLAAVVDVYIRHPKPIMGRRETI